MEKHKPAFKQTLENTYAELEVIALDKKKEMSQVEPGFRDFRDIPFGPMHQATAFDFKLEEKAANSRIGEGTLNRITHVANDAPETNVREAMQAAADYLRDHETDSTPDDVPQRAMQLGRYANVLGSIRHPIIRAKALANSIGEKPAVGRTMKKSVRVAYNVAAGREDKDRDGRIWVDFSDKHALYLPGEEGNSNIIEVNGIERDLSKVSVHEALGRSGIVNIIHGMGLSPSEFGIRPDISQTFRPVYDSKGNLTVNPAPVQVGKRN